MSLTAQAFQQSWIDSGALYRGRNAWNNAGSYWRLYYSSSSGNTVKAGYYGNNGVPASTLIWTNLFGYIVQAETKFNRSYPWSTSGAAGAFDVQNIAAHEFGHWLLLNDLYGGTNYYKTMYYNADYGETYKRTLHSDDIAAVKYIYGAQ